MTKCISFGGFPQKSKYIFLSALFLFLNDCIFGMNYNNIFRDIRIIPASTQKDFKQHKFIRYIFCYGVTCILSYFFYTREIFNSKRESKAKIENESEKSKNKLIHQDTGKISFSKETHYFLLFILFLWTINEPLIDLLINVLKHIDIWMIELIVVSYLCQKMLKIEIFSHHKLAMILNIFPCIIKIITIVLSFKDKNNYGDGKNFYHTEGNLKILYVVFNWLIPIGVIFYFFLIFIRSYVYTKIKWLMDLKYISQNRLLMIHGFMGAVIYTIITIISTFFSCKKYETQKEFNDISDYFCGTHKSEENFTYNYFSNFYIYFTTTSNFFQILCEIITLFLGSITFFFYKYYSILTIKYLTPIHLVISIPIFYLVQKIILPLFNKIFDGDFYVKRNGIEYLKKIFVLDIIGDVFAFIGFLVYFEIVELNFYGLNFNLRKSIIDRERNEFSSMDDIIPINIGEEENEENNGNIKELNSIN